VADPSTGLILASDAAGGFYAADANSGVIATADPVSGIIYSADPSGSIYALDPASGMVWPVI
jgi:hypothetical protein